MSGKFAHCLSPGRPCDAVVESRKKLQRTAKLSYLPIRNSKGDTFVPCHWMTGTFSSHFPEWLRHDICPDNYAAIIAALNTLTSDSQVWSEHRLSELAELDAKVAEYIREQDKLALNRQMNEKLLEINHKWLNPLGLHMTSTLFAYCKMGIIITRIPIHCDLTQSPDCHSPDDDLVIFPSYEYSSDEGSDMESTSCSLSESLRKLTATIIFRKYTIIH